MASRGMPVCVVTVSAVDLTSSLRAQRQDKGIADTKQLLSKRSHDFDDGLQTLRQDY